MNAPVAAILAAIITCLASGSSPPVGVDAVWTPPEGFLQKAHRDCDGRSGDASGSCFLSAMKSAGAPEAALAFARRTGNQGYLRLFRETGIVDIACAAFPFRANENDVCFLVNGSPPMIQVDDPKNWDEPALARNRGYDALRRRYPNLAIFPGDRGNSPAIREGARPSGGQEFAVEYFLQDGCHACARIASMRLAFDFDPTGRFEGSRLVTIRLLPH